VNLQTVRFFRAAAPTETNEQDIVMGAGPSFEEMYEACVGFVFRTARRLGVAEGSVDDVVQEVFVVVHRRLDDFDGRASMKGWVYGILARVAANHRRLTRRRETFIALSSDGEPEAAASSDPGPSQIAEQQEAARWVLRILDMLDDQKREVLVLSELEHMSLSEVAGAIGSNVNTVYSRLKAAKKAFVTLHIREQARAASRRPR
jgi:RNA polymerase sigma-70 factor (ECF subfamily)